MTRYAYKLTALSHIQYFKMHEDHAVLFDPDHPGALNVRGVGTGVSW